MSLTATIGTTVEEVLALVDELDEIRVGDRDLRAHSLACAGLAMDAGADDTLVTATLLHDVGRARYLARQAPGVPHEEVGRRFVEDRFGPRAGWLVATHMVARRYLGAVDDDYVAGLPRTARTSLRRQGGPLSSRQVTAFESHEWAADAVALRRWADAALGGDGTAPDHGALADCLRRAWTA